VSVAELLRLTLRAPSTTGTSALKLWLRHPHHLFGDTVCFLLMGVSRSIYYEFWLNVYCCFSMHWYLGEIMTKGTRCGRIGDGLKAIGFSPQQELHRLIANRAL
jgi:hypothetical protein